LEEEINFRKVVKLGVKIRWEDWRELEGFRGRRNFIIRQHYGFYWGAWIKSSREGRHGGPSFLRAGRFNGLIFGGKNFWGRMVG